MMTLSFDPGVIATAIGCVAAIVLVLSVAGVLRR